ncbi:hypothetical protein E2C01_043831 [Portunus trituberculatus]|uniref:Uncharacterized protein n=1 Tax=Portunus trituberculatus TaxID=210409 RepID=A0A5B7FTY4_PORTR|nr:hypothetical protein [Portunus trituberculatus]
MILFVEPAIEGGDSRPYTSSSSSSSPLPHPPPPPVLQASAASIHTHITLTPPWYSLGHDASLVRGSISSCSEQITTRPPSFAPSPPAS